MSDAPGIFEALGDPVRRQLLVALSAGEQPVGALVAALNERRPISQPAVSQHLAVLRSAGLVAVRADGTRRLHSLRPDGVAVARRWLADLVDPLAAAGGPLDALATEVARGQRGRRDRASRTASSRTASGEQAAQRTGGRTRRSSA